jgi:hypothetical protein
MGNKSYLWDLELLEALDKACEDTIKYKGYTEAEREALREAIRNMSDM